ncbi:HNH endonuclease signature motif containing protein [Paenibacillus sp. 2TAB26]|uniref:HNH endonuclease signature motif containing protein n=1 Tax=Paenibacillus sp. 2TAB26 TaxID=3233005 RepID=UPI003F9AF563
MIKKLLPIFLSLLLVFTLGFNQRSSAEKIKYEDFNLEKKLIESIEQNPDDVFLKEVRKYLTTGYRNEVAKKEITAGVSPSSYKTYIIVYDDKTGKSLTLEEYLIEKEKSLNKNRNINSFNAAAAPANAVIFNVYLTSSVVNKTITHKVVYSSYIGKAPTSISISNRLKSSTSRNGTYSTEATSSETMKKVLDASEPTTVASTKYWKGDFTAQIYSGTVLVSVHNGGTDVAQLYNKNGVVYPPYTDQHSGIVMIEPATTSWARVPSISWSGRDAYIKWYETQYGVPNWNWDDYQIHHIRPRNLGGTNVYSNLIPLVKTFHTGTVNPWFAAY